jgi:hypothetical protein
VPHPALDRYVAGLVGLPTTPPLSGAPRCTTPGAAPAPLGLDVPGRFAAPAGACPAGWERLGDEEIGSPAAAPRFGHGELAVCRRVVARGERGERPPVLVSARLGPLADPPLPAIDASVLLLGAPPAHLRALEAWACGCDHLTPRGVSDLGHNAYLSACPRLGMPLGLLLADSRGRVRRFALIP